MNAPPPEWQTPAAAQTAPPDDVSVILAQGLRIGIRFVRSTLKLGPRDPAPKELAAMEGALGMWERAQKQAHDALVVAAAAGQAQ